MKPDFVALFRLCTRPRFETGERQLRSSLRSLLSGEGEGRGGEGELERAKLLRSGRGEKDRKSADFVQTRAVNVFWHVLSMY